MATEKSGAGFIRRIPGRRVIAAIDRSWRKSHRSARKQIMFQQPSHSNCLEEKRLSFCFCFFVSFVCSFFFFFCISLLIRICFSFCLSFFCFGFYISFFLSVYLFTVCLSVSVSLPPCFFLATSLLLFLSLFIYSLAYVSSSHSNPISLDCKIRDVLIKDNSEINFLRRQFQASGSTTA